MTIPISFRHPALPVLVDLAIFFTYASAFAFGAIRADPRHRNYVGTIRIDRIDRVSPDYDCYSVVQTESINPTLRNVVNPTGSTATIRAAMVANWDSTAQMDAVAFYTSSDCSEDSKAMIIRWYDDMKFPQMAYLVPALTPNEYRVPIRLAAYKAVVIPPGPAPAEDYELARNDFGAAVLKNPGLLKPGSVYALPSHRGHVHETYCEGLVRKAVFGDPTIEVLGRIAQEYFRDNPDADQVPGDVDVVNWPKLKGMFEKQLAQLRTGVTSADPHTRGRQWIYMPGVFECKEVPQEAYVDARSPIQEEEGETVIQQGETVLDTDQIHYARGTGLEQSTSNNQESGNLVEMEDSGTIQTTGFPRQVVSDSYPAIPGLLTEQFQEFSMNPRSFSEDRDRGAITAPGTGISRSLQSNNGPQLSISTRRGTQEKKRKEKPGVRLKATVIPEVEDPEGQSPDEIEEGPRKVNFGQGRQGFRVPPSSDSGSRSNIITEDSMVQPGIYLNPVERNLIMESYPGKEQDWRSRIYNSIPIGNPGINTESMNDLVRLLKQGFGQLTREREDTREESKEQNESGHPGVHIPIPRYTQWPPNQGNQEEKNQRPQIQGSMSIEEEEERIPIPGNQGSQNGINPSQQQSESFSGLNDLPPSDQ
ncbi:hypothetical protein TWF281_005834 [Arthrobotrys megalospora]